MLEFNGTGIIIAISFILFVILENFIFYRPMRKMLDDREDYIAKNEADANQNMSEANNLTEDKNKKISEAKQESFKIINDTSIKIQDKFSNSIKAEKEILNKQVEEIKNTLETEKEIAQNTLKAEIGNYASTIVSKVLKRDISLVNINDEMIDKALRGEL